MTVACGSGGTRAVGPQPISAYPPRDIQSARPQTRAERSGFTQTSTYADVIAFIDSIKASPHLHVTTMGRSTRGRDIPLLIASRP